MNSTSVTSVIKMSYFIKLQPFYWLSTGRRNFLLLNTRKISTTTTNALQIRQRNVPASVEQKLRRTDEVSANYQLIYRAPMEVYMKWSKNVSTVSAGIVAAIGGYKWMFEYDIITIANDLKLANMVTNESDIWWFAGAFVALNFAIRIFVAKYPLRIYKNEDKYIAVYDSQLPFRTSKHSFSRGDVATINQYFNPFSDCMYRLGNRTSLLLIDYFKTPSDLSEMTSLK